MEQEKPITKDSRSSSEKPIIEEMYVTQKDEPAIEPKRKKQYIFIQRTSHPNGVLACNLYLQLCGYSCQ